MKTDNTINPSNFVSKYFEPEPGQWGFRGDPHLWRDMRHKTENKSIPASVSEFKKMLFELFKNLTGRELQKSKDIYVEKYATTGMSKGMISSGFWLEYGFPVLIQRYLEDEL